METHPGLPISFEEREKTPIVVKAVLIALWEENQASKQQVPALESQIKSMQAEEEKLKKRVNKTSLNSSKPPSSDLPGMKTKPKREEGKRPRGGKKDIKGRGES